MPIEIVIIQQIVIAIIIFVSLLVLVYSFDSNQDYKIRRTLILTIVYAVINIATSLIESSIGLEGQLYFDLIAPVIGLIAMMKIYSYDFSTAFLFSLGLTVTVFLLSFVVNGILLIPLYEELLRSNLY